MRTELFFVNRVEVPDGANRDRGDVRPRQILIAGNGSLIVGHAVINAVVRPGLEHPKCDLGKIDRDFSVVDRDPFGDGFHRTVKHAIIGRLDGRVDQKQSGKSKRNCQHAARNEQVEKEGPLQRGNSFWCHLSSIR